MYLDPTFMMLGAAAISSSVSNNTAAIINQAQRQSELYNELVKLKKEIHENQKSQDDIRLEQLVNSILPTIEVEICKAKDENKNYDNLMKLYESYYNEYNLIFDRQMAKLQAEYDYWKSKQETLDRQDKEKKLSEYQVSANQINSNDKVDTDKLTLITLCIVTFGLYGIVHLIKKCRNKNSK